MLGEGGASEEMALKLKTTQKSYDKFKKKAKSEGINDFVFNAELPIHKKSSMLQKTEDEQVKSLVERKGAFSAGGLWMTLGFQLMGSKATIRAQVAQIEQEKAAAKKSVKKKADEMKLKVEKADESFRMFKSGQRCRLKHGGILFDSCFLCMTLTLRRQS
mmetsp:Transcript_19916/g.40199  ORF Transcript_19916/g.40199 Transcript_19916/m.40199 type:complete len:160 (-) Transcript_19916:193-672(-)